MIKVRLQELLDRDERSLNWVATKTNLSYASLHKLVNSKTTSISFDVLDKLCDLFKCNTEDIIQHIEE